MTTGSPLHPGGRGAFVGPPVKELENFPWIGNLRPGPGEGKGNRVASGGLRPREILMRIRSIAASLATTALLGGAIVVPTTAAQAESSPAQKALGNRSLAKVLTSDGNRFDRNWGDYDIVTEAALAVIKAKPNSPVSVLTKGKVPVTAFIPNDWSFRKLAKDLTGTRFTTERQVFNALAGLGIDTIETVLLYHVVPGATIDSKTALGATGSS